MKTVRYVEQGNILCCLVFYILILIKNFKTSVLQLHQLCFKSPMGQCRQTTCPRPSLPSSELEINEVAQPAMWELERLESSFSFRGTTATPTLPSLDPRAVPP